ncbi:hypothetical protein HNP60_000781 [Sphingobium sp. B1D3A]|uniref:Uncharacterized protein n=1 Tax=Sphingobium lignivorans TaxID=2735886 RepID=A0ABR6NBZ1_9SPHN|nr:hypothetical protein [Sphingobium lignivorans]
MSGVHSVEKIGGTSMAATATLLDNVLIAGRSGADLYNRIFVVSGLCRDDGPAAGAQEDRRVRRLCPLRGG